MSATLLTLLITGTLGAEDRLPWPDRSGPTLNGHASPSDAQGLPTTWDESTGKNIVWKIDLPALGHSTPVVAGGQIWFTSATEDGTEQFIDTVDFQSGDFIRHKRLWVNEDPEPLGNPINSYASPSCVLEPGAAYVHFGSYGTARLDPETADIVWQRRDIECRHFRGPGSSPIVFQNLLILTFDGIDQQFLMALDKQTGETVWRTDRTTDYGDLDKDGRPKRDGDLRKAYSTPAFVKAGNRWHLVSAGSRAAFGYDALTGEELWTITHDDFNAAAKPSFIDNLAIINTGARGANLLAVRLDDTTRGNVDKTHVVWNRERGNARLASPVVIDDRVYQITDNGVVSSVDGRTGEELWVGRVGGTIVSSPVTANGLIYFCSEEGVTSVVRAGEEFEIVAKSELSEGMRASPAVAHGSLLLRTFHHLYRIGNTEPQQ